MIKYNKDYQYSFFILFLIIGSCSMKPPIWLEKRPVENFFWHGIGFALKDNGRFIDLARKELFMRLLLKSKLI